MSYHYPDEKPLFLLEEEIKYGLNK